MFASRWKTLMCREGDVDASRWKTLMLRDGRLWCVGWHLCFSMEDFDASVDVCDSWWKTLMHQLTFVLLDGRLWWFGWRLCFSMEHFVASDDVSASRWKTLLHRMTFLLLNGRLCCVRWHFCFSMEDFDASDDVYASQWKTFGAFGWEKTYSRLLLLAEERRFCARLTKEKGCCCSFRQEEIDDTFGWGEKTVNFWSDRCPVFRKIALSCW